MPLCSTFWEANRSCFAFLIVFGTVVAIVGALGQLPNPWRDLPFTGWEQIVVIVLGVALVIPGLIALLFPHGAEARALLGLAELKSGELQYFLPKIRAKFRGNLLGLRASIINCRKIYIYN
jgi:hypothetical protein